MNARRRNASEYQVIFSIDLYDLITLSDSKDGVAALGIALVLLSLV